MNMGMNTIARVSYPSCVSYRLRFTFYGPKKRTPGVVRFFLTRLGYITFLYASNRTAPPLRGFAACVLPGFRFIAIITIVT